MALPPSIPRSTPPLQLLPLFHSLMLVLWCVLLDSVSPLVTHLNAQFTVNKPRVFAYAQVLSISPLCAFLAKLPPRVLHVSHLAFQWMCVCTCVITPGTRCEHGLARDCLFHWRRMAPDPRSGRSGQHGGSHHAAAGGNVASAIHLLDVPLPGCEWSGADDHGLHPRIHAQQYVCDSSDRRDFERGRERDVKASD